MEFLCGNAGAKATLKQMMNDVNRDAFALTFKRGDKFIVPHEANNDDFIGNQDYYHARMTADKLNKLK